MGTMDVISLDDTADNDASLFIIDEEPILESPVTSVMKEVTNKQASKRRKRKSDIKKKLAKKKKLNSGIKNNSNGRWLVLGSNKSQSSNNILAKTNGTNSSSTRTGSESRTSSEIDVDSISSSLLNSDLETIVIQSDEEDDMDVIELSDEEVGTIGGELSTAVHRAQGQLSAFQSRGGKITQAWPNSPRKNRSYRATKSFPANKPGTAPRLRPIVIDGSNVAFG